MFFCLYRSTKVTHPSFPSHILSNVKQASQCSFFGDCYWQSYCAFTLSCKGTHNGNSFWSPWKPGITARAAAKNRRRFSDYHTSVSIFTVANDYNTWQIWTPLFWPQFQFNIILIKSADVLVFYPPLPINNIRLSIFCSSSSVIQQPLVLYFQLNSGQMSNKQKHQEFSILWCLTLASLCNTSYLSKGRIWWRDSDSPSGWCIFKASIITSPHLTWNIDVLVDFEWKGLKAMKWDEIREHLFLSLFLWNLWLNKRSIFHLPLTQHIFLLSTFVWIDEKEVRINVEQDTFQHRRPGGEEGGGVQGGTQLPSMIRKGGWLHFYN